MKVKKERRRRMRVPLEGEVDMTGGGKLMKARALNIGAEGMSVVAPDKVRKKTEVSLEFSLPGEEGRFAIHAIVVRVERNPEGFKLGLRFKTEGWVMAHVQEYVRNQLKRMAQAKKRGAPRQEEPKEAPAPRPFRQEQPAPKPQAKDGEYKPDKMAIDLDRSERASEVARLFKEAIKKKD